MKQGKVEVFNKNYFISLSDYRLVWTLYEDGKKVQESDAFVNAHKIIGPREKLSILFLIIIRILKKEANIS